MRLLRQQHADFQPLLLAVRQRRRPARSRCSVKPSGLEDLVDARLLRRRCLPSNSVGARPAVALQREQQIVHDRVHLEHRRLLKLAADAELGDLGLVELRQIVRTLPKQTSPVSGRVLPVIDVHHRGLAGAVRPDDRAHLARLDDEATDR